MAKVRNNIVTRGLSGKLGKLIVFRQVGDETIVTTVPVRKAYAPSEVQKKQVSRFQRAIIYAKKAMQDEGLKAAYQMRAKGNRNAFNIAIADFLNPPEIEAIDVSRYKGTKDSRLLVRVTDDHRVSGVNVSIYQEDDTLVEQGAAIAHENGLDWIYTVQKTNTHLKGSKLLIRASDIPGNISEREQVLV